MRSRIMVAVVSCLVTAAVVGGFAVAAIPNGNTIHACRNKTTFALRVIDKSLGQACTSNETSLSWSSWRWKGPYSATLAYVVGDVVRWNGSSYLARGPAAPPTGTPPSNGTYWALVAQKGDTGATGPQGTPGLAGLSREVQMFTINPGYTNLDLPCPAGKDVIGGGYQNSHDDLMILNAVPHVELKQFEVRVRNPTASPQTIWVHAICVAGFADLSREVQMFTINPGYTNLDLPCPAGKDVIGGGYQNSHDDLMILNAVPHVELKQFEVRVRNPTAFPQTIWVHAICVAGF